MSVEVVQVQVGVPKEMNDVKVALVSVIHDVKAGKPIAEIAAGNFPKLVDALNGVDQLDDAAKEKLQESLNCAALFGAEVAGALLAPKVQP
jgi:hypothetical protein